MCVSSQGYRLSLKILGLSIGPTVQKKTLFLVDFNTLNLICTTKCNISTFFVIINKTSDVLFKKKKNQAKLSYGRHSIHLSNVN